MIHRSIFSQIPDLYTGRSYHPHQQTKRYQIVVEKRLNRSRISHAAKRKKQTIRRVRQTALDLCVGVRCAFKQPKLYFSTAQCWTKTNVISTRRSRYDYYTGINGKLQGKYENFQIFVQNDVVLCIHIMSTLI